MSKAQNLVVGERVSLIPFKHKGKIGIIKFIGEIEGKNQGNWVGIELDEPKGDCNGDCNGETIFDCKPDHGIFLRPTQVKSLDNDKMNESSIMKMDESLFSGMDQFLGNGSLISQDLKQLEKNLFKDPTLDDEIKFQDVHFQKDEDPGIEKKALVGKVLGWKERIQKLREDKEKEKKILEDSKIQQSTEDGGSGSFLTNDSIDKVKDIFAPTKGLERGQDGKLLIDKEKIVEKKEVEFEKKTENLVAEELENLIKNPSASIISQVAELQEKKKEDKNSPQKRLTMAERQALKDQEKKLQVSTDLSKKEPSSSLLKAPSKGLKQPVSGLPLVAGAASATEQRKQKLLEKQKAVNEKMAEKNKQTADKTGTASAIKGSAIKAVKAGNDSATSRNSALGRAKPSLKTDEIKSKMAQTRQSISGWQNKATSRLSGRQSARDGEESKEEAEDDDQSKAGSAKSRGLSANKDKDLQFGRGRQNSKSRDQDVQGLTKRGQSANKDKDLQFGKKDRERSGSKDKLSFGFGKQQPQQEVKLDPSMTTIKIKELEDLKAELDKKIEESYNLTIKMKKAENQCEVLRRDHKDEIDNLIQEITRKNLEQTEELVKKHGEERNKLLQEANQSGDHKYIKLQNEHQSIQKQFTDLQEKLTQTIQDMTLQHKEQTKQIEDQHSVTLTQLETNLNLKIDQLKSSLDEANSQVMKMVEKVQQNKVKIDNLEENIQANKIDMEANQLEIELLLEEKQELLAEMTENNKLEQDDILNTLGTDELKQQNRKLRQAITSLAANFENEKVKLQKQVEDEEGKKKLIAIYEKKLIDMDVLLEELDRKEVELAEVRMENEACLEYETMVEEMAQEIIKKEEDIDKLEKNVKSLEDILTIQEGYSENLEQYNQELAEELADKDAELSQQEQQKIDDEELLLDLEDENQKYRERVQQLGQTINTLSVQLEQHSDDGKEKSKISQLIDKQNSLIHQLKDSEKKELDSQIRKIDYHWETLIKQKVVESIIPPRLSDHVHFDSLQKLNFLNQTLNRGLLMLRYICEKQMPNVVNLYGGDGEEEIHQKLEFSRMMVRLSEQAVIFINSGQRILICLNNMSPEQYVKATTSFMAFNKLQAVSDEMGNVIGKLKDENISIRFDTSLLESLIKLIAELQFKVEKLFIEKTPEEIALEKPSEKEDEKAKYQLSPAQLERQKLIQQSYKLDVRHQSLKMCFGIIALKTFTNDLISPQNPQTQNFGKKALLIYGRLLDIVFKLDHIDAEDTGKQYLNLQDLVIDKRLNEKFEVIKIIWDENSEQDSILKKDWNSIMDAIQKDITQLFNDYKFKRLIKQIEQTYESQNSQTLVNIDQIYFIDKFKNDQTPWMQISSKIKQDIQNSEALKDKIEALNTKIREEVKQNLQQDRTINTMKVTTKSLEQRLAQAQTTIEELNSVKSENEQLQKKTNIQKKSLDQCLKDIESQNKINQDLVKKLDETEKKAALGSIAIEQQMNQSSTQDNLGGFRKAKVGNQPSRQSRTSTFFQELAKTSMLGGRKVDTSMTPMNMSASRNQQKGANTIEMQKQLIQQEDSYTNIIYQLQLDRMRLRGNEISQKLAEIQKKNGALNQYTKLQKEKMQTKTNISREEETQLVNAVEKVMSLKTNAKLQMASIKVVNLQKKKEDILKAQQEEKMNRHFVSKRIQKQKLGADSLQLKSECVKTNMNINYMIMQAREQINEAVKKLMSKDQNLNMLHIDKLTKHAERDNNDLKNNAEAEDLSDDEQSQASISKKPRFENKVVIGSIQMHGKKDGKGNDNLISKDVVFNVKSIRALQNNIGIFSI